MKQEPGHLPSSVRRYDKRVTSLPATSARLPVPRRASAMQSSTIYEGQIEEDQPILMRQRRHWHPLTLLGILFLLFLAGWWLLFQITT